MIFPIDSKNELDVCNTSAFEQVFWKTKPFFKKLEYRFLTVKALRLKAHHFDTKLAHQKPILGQIEW